MRARWVLGGVGLVAEGGMGREEARGEHALGARIRHQLSSNQLP